MHTGAQTINIWRIINVVRKSTKLLLDGELYCAGSPMSKTVRVMNFEVRVSNISKSELVWLLWGNTIRFVVQLLDMSRGNILRAGHRCLRIHRLRILKNIVYPILCYFTQLWTDFYHNLSFGIEIQLYHKVSFGKEIETKLKKNKLFKNPKYFNWSYIYFSEVKMTRWRSPPDSKRLCLVLLCIYLVSQWCKMLYLYAKK